MYSIKVTRRQFLKWLSASAAALGLSQTDLLKMEKSLDAAVTNCTWNFPKSFARVIWIAGAACSGCPTSLLNYIADTADPDPVLNAIANNALGLPFPDIEVLTPQGGDGDLDIAEVVLEIVTIEYAQIIMAASGDLPNNHLANLVLDPSVHYVLLVEGTIQTANNGKYCRIFDIPGDFRGGIWDPYVIYDPVDVRTEFTMAGACLWLASNPRCDAVIALGTCAAFGGVPAAKGSVTGGKSAWEWLNKANGLNKTIVNVPGCPPHPDWFIHTVGAYLLSLLDLDTSLDHKGRPRLTQKPMYHAQDYAFCQDCPRNPTRPGPNILCDARRSAANPNGLCLEKRGCNGYLAGPAHIRPVCPTRKWNKGTNWCVGNNMPCQGCASPGFPDYCSPFYKYQKYIQ